MLDAASPCVAFLRTIQHSHQDAAALRPSDNYVNRVAATLHPLTSPTQYQKVNHGNN